MSVIRVGFVLGQVSWLGGVNYFRNLFVAIKSQPNAQIQPVIFTGMNSDISAFEGLAEVARTPVLDRYTFSWWANKLLVKAFPWRDYSFDFIFKKNKIDLVFHFGTLWRGSSLPSLGWIPDFQHVYYPKFFSKKEFLDRDAQFINIIERCNSLLLSSEDASNDLIKYYPTNKKPTHILRFVSSLHPNFRELPSRQELMERYKLNREWFHIPNQFWAHKNHGVVIEALNLLKSQGCTPLIVATGKTSDYRNEEYFPSFMKRVIDYDLQDEFKSLGVVPYADVVALMLYSVAVINPSLFEGWSTSVEESKALGKKVILSDIAVHREQAPERGYYFEATDHTALAIQIKIAMHEYDEVNEKLHLAKAESKLQVSRKVFAKQFETICIQATYGELE